LTSQTAAGVCS